MNDTIRLERDGGVATLTVDRPDRMNALNTATLDAMNEALDEASGDARALIVTGAGDEAFVAGADVREMAEMDVEAAHAYCERGQEVMKAVESFPAPVVAAVDGYALGGGCELALACDFRVASERAVVGRTEIDLGIIPAWGGTQRLVNLVGDETARRLVFFGDRLDAREALDRGLVGEVVPHGDLVDRVEEMAAELAAKPRFALAAAKEAINGAHEMGQRAGLDFERRVWTGLFGTDDQREGMDAFLDGRPPEFE